jgi:hypothetical protein
VVPIIPSPNGNVSMIVVAVGIRRWFETSSTRSPANGGSVAKTVEKL